MFTRTDLQVVAPVTVPPAAEMVEARSDGGLDVQRRRLENKAKGIQMDTGHRPDEKPQLSIEQRFPTQKRKSQWDAPVEARSYACYSLVPEDEKHDWHPWR